MHSFFTALFLSKRTQSYVHFIVTKEEGGLVDNSVDRGGAIFRYLCFRGRLFEARLA